MKNHGGNILRKKKELKNEGITARNCQPHLNGMEWNVIKKTIWEIIPKHIKDKKVTESGQNGFKKGKASSAKLVAIYNKITISVDEEKMSNFVYLVFIKAFINVSYYILIDKLMKYKLDKWTAR